jgi:hypothetical protein
MRKIHVFLIALALGIAAVLGVAAATRTTALRAAARPHTTTAAQAIAVRAQRLDRLQASLRRSLRAKPPALPPVPAVAQPAPALAAAAPAAAAAAPRIVYRRPAPIVVVKHHANSESDHRELSDGGGEGGD